MKKEGVSTIQFRESVEIRFPFIARFSELLRAFACVFLIPFSILRFSVSSSNLSKNNTRYASSILLVSVLIAPVTIAAPPIPFDRWSASGNGTITATCPGGFTCNDNVTSDNMLQRILINNANNQTYIQVLLADGAVNNTGRLVYESFTNASDNSASGISSKMLINQTGAENLDYSVLLNLGWANSAGAPAIDFAQTVTDTYNAGVTLDYTFDYQQNQNTNGTATGYRYGIRETVRNSAALNGSGNNDVWTFVLRRAGGSFVNAGSATLPGAGGMGGMGGAAGGGAGGGGGGGGAMGAAVATAGATTGATGTTTGGGGSRMARALNNDQVSSTGFTMPANGYGLNTPNTGFPEDTVIGPVTNEPPFVGNLPGSRYNVSDNATNNQNNVNVSTRSGVNGGIVSNGNASGPDIPGGPVDVPTGNPNGMGMGGGPAGGTVAWNTGNEVQVIWIGQMCASCVIGGMGGMGGGSGAFAVQSYENLTTGATAISRSITSTAPLTWTTAPFGPQPGL